jgi:hypothetical protein
MTVALAVYRIENPNTESGMWYNRDGSYNGFVHTLTEGKTADLPMGFCERFGKDGYRWYSAAIDVASMNYWFSPLDAFELKQAGYELYQFEVTQYIIEEFQVSFTREGVVGRTPIPWESIYDLSGFLKHV